MTDRPPITVLIIDDSRADARLMELWLRKGAIVCDLQVVRTGQDAVRFLRHDTPFEQSPSPHVVLLDIHLPDMLGWDLLADLQRDAALSRIPVIVLTGTVSDADARRARELGAVRYLAKPFDADEFAVLVREIEVVAQEARERS